MAGKQPNIDATDLGELLDLSIAQVQEAMRSGKTTTRYEAGEGEDAGKMRISLFHNGRRVRPTCTDQGEVLKVSRDAGRWQVQFFLR